MSWMKTTLCRCWQLGSPHALTECLRTMYSNEVIIYGYVMNGLTSTGVSCLWLRVLVISNPPRYMLKFSTLRKMISSIANISVETWPSSLVNRTCIICINLRFLVLTIKRVIANSASRWIDVLLFTIRQLCVWRWRLLRCTARNAYIADTPTFRPFEIAYNIT